MGKRALCIKNAEDINTAINDADFKVEAVFVDRDICENPENGYLQIIPYVTFYNTNSKKDYIRFVQYKRASAITEERLSAKTSIGFGGHIDNEVDLATNDRIIEDETTIVYRLDISQILETALNAGKREIAEELGSNFLAKLNLEPNLQDFIFFTGNPEVEVNRVHLGVSIPIKLTEEQFDLFFKEAVINPEEIEAIAPLGINLGLVLEEFDISTTLGNIANGLSKEQNLEDWSCQILYYISRGILNELKSGITYQDLLSIIELKKEDESYIESEEEAQENNELEKKEAVAQIPPVIQ